MANRWSGWTWRLAAALLVLGLGSVAAQAPVTTVSIGREDAEPGGPVYIALNYSPAAGDDLRALQLEIRFPKGMITFDMAQADAALLDAGGDLEATAAPDPADATVMVIKVVGRADKPIGEGLLGSLAFTVANDAKRGAVSRFKTQAHGSAQKNLNGAKPLKVIDGSIVVASTGGGGLG